MADPDRACVVSPEEWFAGCVCGMVDRPHDEALMYAALGLGGETGEVLEPIKKSVRTTDPTPLDRDNMVSELGDVMFYAGAIANLLGITLSEIVEANVAKRVARGLISGAGDATDPEPSPVDAVDQPFRVTREQLDAHGAVLATVSTPEGARHYAMLTGPWASVIGPAHPDDTPGVGDG